MLSFSKWEKTRCNFQVLKLRLFLNFKHLKIKKITFENQFLEIRFQGVIRRFDFQLIEESFLLTKNSNFLFEESQVLFLKKRNCKNNQFRLKIFITSTLTLSSSIKSLAIYNLRCCLYKTILTKKIWIRMDFNLE